MVSMRGFDVRPAHRTTCPTSQRPSHAHTHRRQTARQLQALLLSADLMGGHTLACDAWALSALSVCACVWAERRVRRVHRCTECSALCALEWCVHSNTISEHANRLGTHRCVVREGAPHNVYWYVCFVCLVCVCA